MVDAWLENGYLATAPPSGGFSRKKPAVQCDDRLQPYSQEASMNDRHPLNRYGRLLAILALLTFNLACFALFLSVDFLMAPGMLVFATFVLSTFAVKRLIRRRSWSWALATTLTCLSVGIVGYTIHIYNGVRLLTAQSVSPMIHEEFLLAQSLSNPGSEGEDIVLEKLYQLQNEHDVVPPRTKDMSPMFRAWSEVGSGTLDEAGLAKAKIDWIMQDFSHLVIAKDALTPFPILPSPNLFPFALLFGMAIGTAVLGGRAPQPTG